MQTRIREHIRSNVVGYLALFLVLTGGTAEALDGSNTVFSDDIVNGEVQTADLGVGAVARGRLANDAVNSVKVADNSLTGADVVESSLGEVPSARLGGMGRSSTSSSVCNPGSTTFVTCDFVTLQLPAATRLLLIGTVRPRDNSTNGSVSGNCRLASSTGYTSANYLSEADVGDDGKWTTLTAVTPLLGPGAIDLGVECNELSSTSDILYDQATISAVALSPD